jgi:chromosomal replication initiator protein
MTCPPQVERLASAPVPAAATWDVVLARLRAELDPVTFESWIATLAAESGPDGLRLLCPSPFHCERVRERFLERIEGLVEEAAGVRASVTLGVRANPPAASVRRPGSAGPEPASGPRPLARVAPAAGAAARADDVPELTLDFEGFVVAPGNALAREACIALARGRQLAVSPLYVAAGPGLGKTHLACAVAAAVRARGERVVYVSAEQFTNELMASIREQRTAELKRRYRDGCDVLVFEDVHFLCGKRQTQLELLHTLEHLERRGARVLVTAERLPREIPEFDPRLASRLGSGLVAEIEPPDGELRRAVLRTKAAAAGVALPPRCLERLADAGCRSVRDLESALVQVLASASLLRRPIDLPLVETALRKVLAGTAGGALPPERIAELVAAHFRTTVEALASRTRRRDVLAPRQIAMYLCTRHTDASLQTIGRVFARNHPSVANAVRAVERALAARPAARERLALLVAEIEALSGTRKGPRRSPPRPRPMGAEGDGPWRGARGSQGRACQKDGPHLPGRLR